MTTTRDDQRRVPAYLTSAKPLFQQRKIQRTSIFTRPRAPREEPLVSPEDWPASRNPRPSPPKTKVSLRDAYEWAIIEEEQEAMRENGHAGSAEIQGSPS